VNWLNASKCNCATIAETGEVGFICHIRLDVAAMYAKAFAVLQGVRAPAAD